VRLVQSDSFLAFEDVNKLVLAAWLQVLLGLGGSESTIMRYY
jgi:hypothetical protein